MPQDIGEIIKRQLNEQEVGPSSFIALVNSVSIFRIGSDKAELAARALKLGSYRLANVEDKLQLIAVLNGLARFAAITRSSLLANELRILMRRYRHDAQYNLTLNESVGIYLVSAASFVDHNDWVNFVGDFLTEFAFGELDVDDAKYFIRI